ncbi:MAG: ribonuclease Z [Candidatus Thalassarchaeaceae archaeon]|jgi:ribonuclease BN (tRNA processing enzyme)|nr:ribonuclease Z [Candidatus Thalassarchaeaceae archaeon]
MVKIQFLGTGNAFCPNDRLHSLVLIDEHILVDAPPTIVPQLRRAGIQPSEICDLLITHWHGDHTFGIPFLLLERKYISDRGGKANLTIHCHEGGGKILQNLCNLAYPDSLTNLPWMNVDESQSGVIGDWKFSRFEVCHNPSTDPHGYRLEHKDGFVLVHCGDSGPCQNIENLADEADVMILDLGIPDFVDSPYHFSPKTLSEFAMQHPDTIFMATHNYCNGIEIDSDKVGGYPMVTLPSNVIQTEDGDTFVH